MTPDDLIFAFFPCIMFAEQNVHFFTGTLAQWKGKGMQEKADLILERNKARNKMYELAIKFFAICETRRLRLIVENPHSPFHYLTNNFPWKAAIVDKNRRRRGDYFRKPTQYFYVNCEPTVGYSYEAPTETKNVKKLTGHKGSMCDEERSLIAPAYARNFICDFILGKQQIGKEQLLFTYD